MAKNPEQRYGLVYMTIGIMLVLASIAMLVYVLVRQWLASDAL